MHGRLWHDHQETRSIEREYMAGSDAVPEVEAGEERQGMGKHVGRKDKGSTRVNTPTSRGKGKPGINKKAQGSSRR